MTRSISPTELHLKVRILNELRRAKRIRPSTIIANELPLGTAGVRADLAVYSRRFIGIEIKSDRDSLKRLKHQLPVYQNNFDKTILVVGSKHADELSKLDLLNVEVWIASGLSLRRISAVEQDLTEQNIEPRQACDRRTPERRAYLSNFRERFQGTSKIFWREVQGRPIAAADLALLSRFQERRDKVNSKLRENEIKREQWMSDLSQSIQSSSVSRKAASS